MCRNNPAEVLDIHNMGSRALQARQRKNPTRAEGEFYAAVRRWHGWDFSETFNTQEYKFQMSFGPFLLDAVFPRKMLVVELDGYVHCGRERYDGLRTRFIEACGLKVIRFANEEVLADPDGVVASVMAFPDVVDASWVGAKRMAKEMISRGGRLIEVAPAPDNSTRLVKVHSGRRFTGRAVAARPRCPLCNFALAATWSACHGCKATIHWLE